jgi:hypothetical protein
MNNIYRNDMAWEELRILRGIIAERQTLEFVRSWPKNSIFGKTIKEDSQTQPNRAARRAARRAAKK